MPFQRLFALRNHHRVCQEAGCYFLLLRVYGLRTLKMDDGSLHSSGITQYIRSLGSGHVSR